ncbi:DUF4190 domain-containing protein [Streptomyces sp. NPDC048419]|uniref:DUF4190 domain-containing protein n=1 Tax=Streptomyces sp. NPDC048419 TaxID=3365547 RepID=UPI00371938B5
MSDDAQTPAARDPWAAPSEADSRDAAPKVPLGKQDGSAPEPNLWAPPANDGQPGPGYTIAGTDVPAAAPGSGPAGPAHPSVHDQQTVTSMPGVGDTAPPSQPWANPFTPPAATPPAGPYGPPAHHHGEPVPPPPIAPEGPGQVPYGYGYPQQSGYGAPGPQSSGLPGYYGWPGLAAVPSNGMGTAALVIGIIAVVVFCLWPIAILLGVLAVIFGSIGRAKARRGEATNAGQSLAGIICGAVGIVLGLVMIAVLIANP